MDKDHNLVKSFIYAISGIKLALKHESNFRIHFISAIVVLTSGLILGLSVLEWSLIIFIIFFVLIMELLNTAIETVVDMISPEFSQKAKTAKDVSAASVLLTSILALMIGLLIFLPKILVLLAL